MSVVSLWEAAIKIRSGKLLVEFDLLLDSVEPSGFDILGLDAAHLSTLAELPLHRNHSDPFDRLLIAQAISEEMTFVSDDRHVAHYSVPSLPCRF